MPLDLGRVVMDGGLTLMGVLMRSGLTLPLGAWLPNEKLWRCCLMVRGDVSGRELMPIQSASSSSSPANRQPPTPSKSRFGADSVRLTMLRFLPRITRSEPTELLREARLDTGERSFTGLRGGISRLGKSSGITHDFRRAKPSSAYTIDARNRRIQNARIVVITAKVVKGMLKSSMAGTVTAEVSAAMLAVILRSLEETLCCHDIL